MIRIRIRKKIAFILITLLQLLFLSGMVFFHAANIKTATTVLLETQPIDPFSVFRGRYVALDYKISSLPAEAFKDCKPDKLKSGDYIYVVLEQKEKFWETKAVYKNKPLDKNLIFLRGKIYSAYSPQISVKYGIESFFLSEKSAEEIEKKRSEFATFRWQEMERKRKENLSEEDRRIEKAGINKWWFGIMDKELNYWIKEAIVDERIAEKIREKYSKTLEHISATERRDVTSDIPRSPLTIEVAVTKDGRGYPVKLLWEGREYK